MALKAILRLNISKMLTLLGLIACTFYIKETNAQEPCRLPNGNQATCVVLDRCPLIMGILRDAPKPLPAEVAAYIKSIHCGRINNKNAVCCLQTLNPTTTTAAVVDVPTSPVNITNHPNLRLLPTANCGPISTQKIASGDLSELFEFPWMALLRYQTPDGLRNSCGGSLINNRYVLTAAHCVARLRSGYSLYSVILGEYDTRTDVDCQTIDDTEICSPAQEEILVDQITAHPQYNRPPFANDIAVVRLSRTVSFDQEHIQPVCLPTTWILQRLDLRYLIVSGWGTTEEQVQSPVLLKARLGVTPITECQTIHRRIQFTNNQICAKGNGTVDTCKGDSGGPLVYPANLDGTKYVQFGVVSAGVPGCGEGDAKPGIYVRVQNYMHWILDNIRD